MIVGSATLSSASAADPQATKPTQMYAREPREAERVAVRYPERAFAECVEGTVFAEVEASPDGKVKRVTITSVKPKGYDFEKEVRRAILQWRYRPEDIARLNPPSWNTEFYFEIPADARENCSSD
jgi:TonB family protein